MKEKQFYFYLVFLLFYHNQAFTQKISLQLSTNNKNQQKVLNEINYKKRVLTEEDAKKEINQVLNRLKKNGYFTSKIESVVKLDSVYKIEISLGNKINYVSIRIEKKDHKLIPKIYQIKDSLINITINELPNLLSETSNNLDKQGKSFSETQLKNISVKNDSLFANLQITQSETRKIDRIIIKGYDNFSKSHIQYFLGVKKRTILNKEKLKQISSSIKSLNFVSEIKPPEVLFSKDSTLLYIYLQKNNENTFDGLINFSSKENKKGIVFTGHLDLQLKNILHTGEEFDLLWKANGEDSQEFTIEIKTPYIFNLPVTPNLLFQIYKNDSSFINTRFKTSISYNLNSKTSVGLTYHTENSQKSNRINTLNTLESFNNYFIGGLFSFKIPTDNPFSNNLLYINLNPSFGERSILNEKTSQVKIDFTAHFLWSLNYKSSLFIKNETGALISESFTENEFYRIGGASSIRGFNELSIFTPQYTFLNIEYRFLTSPSSFLYSITDIGCVKVLNSKNILLGVGFGYQFKVNKSKINIGYVLGKNKSTSFNINNSKLLIRLSYHF